jgi:hypothetical protein
MKVPYHIVVEPQEYNDYVNVIDEKQILILPFSNLGQGSIPARNWVWEHSKKTGTKRHWIIDDNIEGFYRLNKNYHSKVTSGTIFKVAEDFVDRYVNVGLAGFQYDFFVRSRAKWPAFTLNTRIYSCILIDNSIPYKWRGKYNEDTDLSIRVLSGGFCTILFYAFVQAKTPTMRMKGGNTDELYKGNGRLKMAQSLQEQHPYLACVREKFGRPHHHVNYKPFKNNKLIRKKNLVIQEGVNNYGMVLKKIGNNHDSRYTE